MTSNHPRHHKPIDPLSRQSTNPLISAKRQAPTLFSRWFTHGESLNTFQRAGYSVLSLMCVAFGLFGIRGGMDAVQMGVKAAGLYFGMMGICMVVVGVFGLKNVLRFPSKSENGSAR